MENTEGQSPPCVPRIDEEEGGGEGGLERPTETVLARTVRRDSHRGNNGLQKPQYILCSVVFSNSNLKPSKLQEHFKNKHGGADVEGHDVGSLKIKKTCFDSQGTLPKLGFVSVERPLLLASYQVAYKVAKSKKALTIVEDLIKPCALEMATIILGKEARKKFEQVPLSNNVIHNLISD
ncbi:protein FAM200C-like [Hypanus sabinus]|uniref:protein FAM200C-like n=1 Tax=Hypanus sabinus TaxID=79690 RepID=UPI0028C4FFBB|nr:protein FAM200C-like [Hypanus sabinus]